MIIKVINRVLFKRRKKKTVKSDQPDYPNTLPVTQVATTQRTPEWEKALTASLRENCLAPADEVILHAFDLYCDELNKPVHERQRRMAGLFSEVTTEFAQLQSLAPDMVERAAAKHRLELNHFTDSKGDI